MHQLALAELPNDSLKLVVTPSLQVAYQIEAECHFFNPDMVVNIFPDWEVLPYDHFSPHEDIISQRLALLRQLKQYQSGYLIISIGTLMHRFAPVDINGQSIIFSWPIIGLPSLQAPIGERRLSPDKTSDQSR